MKFVIYLFVVIMLVLNGVLYGLSALAGPPPSQFGWFGPLIISFAVMIPGLAIVGFVWLVVYVYERWIE